MWVRSGGCRSGESSVGTTTRTEPEIDDVRAAVTSGVQCTLGIHVPGACSLLGRFASIPGLSHGLGGLRTEVPSGSVVNHRNFPCTAS